MKMTEYRVEFLGHINCPGNKEWHCHISGVSSFEVANGYAKHASIYSPAGTTRILTRTVSEWEEIGK